MILTIKAITLEPVRHPTISINTWLVLFWFNFLINLKLIYDRIPPPISVNPIKNAASESRISLVIKAYNSEAEFENKIWYATVADTTVGSIPRKSKVNIMVVLEPKPKAPPLNPPKKLAATIRRKYLISSSR